MGLMERKVETDIGRGWGLGWLPENRERNH